MNPIQHFKNIIKNEGGWVAWATLAASLLGAHLANQNNSSEGDKNRKFQENLSGSARQRDVNDLKAAGLNPLLAATGGASSTPSGSMPQMQDVLNKGLASALEMKRYEKELKAVDSQAALNQAQGETAKAQEKLNTANAKVAFQNAQAQEAQMPAIKQKAKNDLEREQLDSKFIKSDTYMKKIREGLGIVSDAASIVKPRININAPKGVMNNKTGEYWDPGTFRKK